MQLPIVKHPSIVEKHSVEFEKQFSNSSQYEHFKNYLTGLMILENKSLANISRCILESADKTNLSRFFSEADWDEMELNAERIGYMLAQTEKQRLSGKRSVLPIDDTLCEHVGSLFEYVDRHYNHGDGRYPLAHNIVTSHYVSGAVRFPLDWRLYRRYNEFTQWEAYVEKHFPGAEIPKKSKERNKFKKQVEATLLADPEFKALHDQFQTKITLAKELVQMAVEHQVPFETVLFDSWYLAPELLTVLAAWQKNWISLLKLNRNIQTQNLSIKDDNGQAISFDDPKIKVEDLIPLIPKSAFKPVQIGEQTYYCFTKNVRIASLGKVRIVISFDNPDLEGTCAVLITNHLSWGAKKIIQTYLLRWPIETFYQDAKQNLGLNEYRMRQSHAIQKHWSLVFVAYSFLHLHTLPASSRKSKVPIKSIGQVIRQQSQQVVEDLILHAHHLLNTTLHPRQVFDQLFLKQAYTMSP